MLSSHDSPVEFTRQLAEESVQRKAVAVRPPGRRPLRLDQRPDQEHPRQRSGRGPVLAGADARRGRGRPLPRPAAGDPGQRGRGQRRSGRAAAGGGRGPRLRAGRAARVPIDAGPGRHLSGLRAEVERGHGGHRRGPAATSARAACCPCPSTSAARGYARGQAARPRRGLPVRPRLSPTPSPPRTIWASSASTTARPTAVSSGSWPSGSQRSARG